MAMFLSQEMCSQDNHIKQQHFKEKETKYAILIQIPFCPSIVSEHVIWRINQLYNQLKVCLMEIPKIAPNNASVPCFRISLFCQCLCPLLAWSEKCAMHRDSYKSSALLLSSLSGPKRIQAKKVSLFSPQGQFLWVKFFKLLLFLAALAALYLTLVSELVTGCHFRILTQGVTFETGDPSDIWSEWCPDKKTKRQMDTKTKRQKRQKKRQKKTKRQRDKKTKKTKIQKKRQRDENTKRQKDSWQRPKRQFNIVTSGQFRTLAMFYKHLGNVHSIFIITVINSWI